MFEFCHAMMVGIGIGSECGDKCNEMSYFEEKFDYGAIEHRLKSLNSSKQPDSDVKDSEKK